MPRKSQRNARRKSKKGYKRGSPASKPTGRSSVSIVARKRDYTASSGSIVRGVMSKMYTMGAFPQQLFAKHIYSDSVLLALNVGGSCSGPHVFRLNSLFDPDFTGTGHQPQGYDNMALQYNRYIVYGCPSRLSSQSTICPVQVVCQGSTTSTQETTATASQASACPMSSKTTWVVPRSSILDTALRSSTWDTAQSGQSRDRVMRKS